LLVPKKESLILEISYVTTDARDLQSRLAELHLVNKLSEDATLVLKTAQVDFYQQINVALVRNFGHWVIVALKRLPTYGNFELQVLACKVA
jgi:hypothetical protein